MRDARAAVAQPDFLCQLLHGSVRMAANTVNANTVMLRLFYSKSFTKFRVNIQQKAFLVQEMNLRLNIIKQQFICLTLTSLHQELLDDKEERKLRFLK